MTRRKPMTPARRLRIAEAHGWICDECGFPIDPVREKWDVDHELALGLGGADDDSNWRPLHVKCHKTKTAVDVGKMSKADAQRAAHLGAKTPKRPMPGSKRSGWRKPMYGPPERRT